MQHKQPAQVTTLLSIYQVMAKVGLSRVTVYRRVKLGKFPKPIYPVPRVPRWRSDTLQEWIDNLPTESAA